jgi:ribonucleoside-diphosphate reductase alpha chain
MTADLTTDDTEIFQEPISEWIWRRRYRRADAPAQADPDTRSTGEADIAATWDRVARALAGVESDHREQWAQRFRGALGDFRFLPGGRILANAGAVGELGNTLFNCFAMDAPTNDVNHMFELLRESMLTLRAGGGIGCDFSAVPPAAAMKTSVHASTGVVAAMKLWDAACAAVTDSSSRPGAMMAVLRDDHPDIAAFVDAKSDVARAAALKHFNLSVLVSDDLMRAVEHDERWPLVFPVRGRTLGGEREIVRRRWSGNMDAEDCEVVASVPARRLWEQIMASAFASAEPGVIFIDRVRRANNLRYCEQIDTTNPCGEVPLPAYGACNLGSINLTCFVKDAFRERAHLDLPGIAATTVIATRMLDNVYDLSGFPLPSQTTVARRSRRLGIGITGLGDALAMLGLHYDAPEAIELAGRVMALICHTAYRASTVLARERGSFPAFEREAYCSSPFVASLPADIVDAIRRYGIRNSHLIAVAPAGSISLLANNVSSGIEPIFAPVVTRLAMDGDGVQREWQVTDWAWAQFRRIMGAGATPPVALSAASQVKPVAQLRMQAALQAHVDNAISKTIAVAAETSFDEFRNIYIEAHKLGLKGCTAYRPNAITGTTLCRCSEVQEEGERAPLLP